MRELSIFLDESGNMHQNSPDRFFVIGGVITEKLLLLYKKYKKANLHLKRMRNFSLGKELKASHMKRDDKIFLLNEIQKQLPNMRFLAIVVDKEKLYRKITRVNLFYNYLIKILLLSLAQKNIINNHTLKIGLLLDNRSIKVASKNSLEDYINIEFNYHLFVKDHMYFYADYLESSSNFNIQLADLVCNTIWSKYNYSKSALEVFETIDWHHLYLCEFPVFSERVFKL
ncbi:MAG: DUF3800 domain-containing protein [bacterium]|nr:DUF3800 domain-containing protein [bacterium]